MMLQYIFMSVQSFGALHVRFRDKSDTIRDVATWDVGLSATNMELPIATTILGQHHLKPYNIFEFGSFDKKFIY